MVHLLGLWMGNETKEIMSQILGLNNMDQMDHDYDIQVGGQAIKIQC